MEIDKRYLDKPYYITPDGKMAAEAFVVIRDAMKDKERVGPRAHRHGKPRAHHRPGAAR
jgi:non-homologous end joining protein Ku